MVSNERLHNLYSLANIIRMTRWVRNVACTEEKKITYKSSVRKTLKKETRYKMQSKWEDTIKMELVRWEDVDWTDLAEDWDQWQDFVTIFMNL
jgi:hypothetical protein